MDLHSFRVKLVVPWLIEILQETSASVYESQGNISNKHVLDFTAVFIAVIIKSVFRPAFSLTLTCTKFLFVIFHIAIAAKRCQIKQFIIISLLKNCKQRHPISSIRGVQITNKSIGISSQSPLGWPGKLKMANPLGPARPAKSWRLTGNEGPLESKQTAYHEVRHPERQLSHRGWDQFMGNHGLFKTPIWNGFFRNLAVKPATSDESSRHQLPLVSHHKSC